LKDLELAFTRFCGCHDVLESEMDRFNLPGLIAIPAGYQIVAVWILL
jgi:hypothetical protein